MIYVSHAERVQGIINTKKSEVNQNLRNHLIELLTEHFNYPQIIKIKLM